MNSKRMLHPITFERFHHSKKRYVMYALVVTFHFLLFGCSLSDMGDPIDIQRPDPPNNHPADETCCCESPESFELVYESSFEDAEKKNSHSLNWNFPNWFEFAALHQGVGDGNGGARFWIENERTHTGTKSIGLELFDIERSRRSEFLIYPQDYVGGKWEEYFVSYWVYLPQDWGLFASNANLRWYEIGHLYNTKGAPYTGIHIHTPDENQEFYTVNLFGRDEQNNKFIEGEKRLLLPKGRWFQICYQVRRDPQNGAIKVWFDGELLAEKSGFPTMHSSNSKFAISIAKIYHDRGDKVPHQLWIDDLKLYTKPDNQ